MSKRGSGTGRRVAVGTVVGLVAAALTVLVPAAHAAAAGLVVTTAADVVADDGVCSLREAIEAADTDTASGASPGECPAGSGADVITFAVAGPVLGNGFFVDSEVVIDGGPDGMVIDGGSGGVTLTAPVFVVSGIATFEAVTITGARNFSIIVGGAIRNSGTTIVERSTITGNDGAYGAITNFGTVHVVNSTLSGNSEYGLANFDGGLASIEYSTITDNDGGVLACADTTASISSSVIAGNAGAEVGACGGQGNWYTSGGYNVIGDGGWLGGFTGTGDVTGVTTPGLGPLGDNGGPTQTHGLSAGSPALDRVTAPVGTDPILDQRGVARPQGVAKDSGAFERDEVVLLPGGFGAAEGDGGSQVFEIPISLSRPATETITVDYVSWPCEIFDGCGDGLATEGVDYESPAPGTLTFEPGEVTKTVPVTVYGDLDVEPVYLWGEWFLIRFLNPSSNAVLDTSFFGLGAGVIGSDDP